MKSLTGFELQMMARRCDSPSDCARLVTAQQLNCIKYGFCSQVAAAILGGEGMVGSLTEELVHFHFESNRIQLGKRSISNELRDNFYFVQVIFNVSLMTSCQPVRYIVAPRRFCLKRGLARNLKRELEKGDINSLWSQARHFFLMKRMQTTTGDTSISAYFC